MEDEYFLHRYNLINKSLANLEVNKTFSSIGSNIFFEFGKERTIIHKNGRKQIKKEWSIWIGLASWRITKHNKYIVGSGDSSKAIEFNIQKLLGRRFQSLVFLSQFLDAEFNFEGGYQITTFFNWMEEDQWTVFFPDSGNIGVDCSSMAALKNVQSTAHQFYISANYEKLDTPIDKERINKITFNEKQLPVFHFKENYYLNLESCTWRLEKSGVYVMGCLDEDLEKTKMKLLSLIGKKLEKIDVANPMMDSRIQFEDGLVLKLFSCCHTEKQWGIHKEKKPVFSAGIPLLETQPL